MSPFLKTPIQQKSQFVVTIFAFLEPKFTNISVPKPKNLAKYPGQNVSSKPGGGVLNFELGTDVRPEVSTTTL